MENAPLHLEIMSLRKRTKRELDKLYRGIWYGNLPSVNLIQWSNEEIDGYTLTENDTYIPQRNIHEPAEKIQKLSDEKDKTVLELVLSSDEESNTVKSQLNTTITNNKEYSNTNSKKIDTEEHYNNNDEKNGENNDMNFSHKPVKVFASKDSFKIGKIGILDMSKLVQPHLVQKLYDVFSPKTAENNEIKTTEIIPKNPNSGLIETTKHLNEIENLYDTAAVQCNINSIFQCSTDLDSSSTVKKVEHLKSPASATQSPLKNDDSIQRCVLIETQNETFQPISVIVPISKTNSPTTQENGKASQQLNFSYESFSNSIAKVPNTVSKLEVPTRIVASSPNGSNGTSTTTCTTTTCTTTMPEASTSYVENKQHTAVRSKTNQLQVVNTTQNNVVKISRIRVRKRADINNTCFATNCRNRSRMKCSKCQSVKYCSLDCLQSDWFEIHLHKCKRLNDIRMRILAETEATEATNH